MSKRQKRLVVISDMHVGSVYALMPPTYMRYDGNRVEANRVQSELFKHWEELCDAWKNPDVLLCNGDIIDGTQPASRGTEAWTTNIDEQIDASTQLLEMLKPRKTYVTTGTSYHVSDSGRKHEETLAANFGSRLYNDLFLEFEGHNIHAAHTISYSKVFHYRTTPVARELLIAIINESKTHPCEWQIRSHVHYFVMVRYGTHAGATTPCWQTRTPYTIRNSPEDVPCIGAVQLVDDGGEWLRLELKEWDPPRPKLEKA